MIRPLQQVAGQLMLFAQRYISNDEFTEEMAEDCDALHQAANEILEKFNAPYRLIRVASNKTGHVRERP